MHWQLVPVRLVTEPQVTAGWKHGRERLYVEGSNALLDRVVLCAQEDLQHSGTELAQPQHFFEQLSHEVFLDPLERTIPAAERYTGQRKLPGLSDTGRRFAEHNRSALILACTAL